MNTTGSPQHTNVVALGGFFAVVYFVQSVGDPGTGIIAQPIRNLLKEWAASPAEIAAFMAIVGLPWAWKPLFGLLSDFLPLFGSRRRNYLILATACAGSGCLLLAGTPLVASEQGLLLAVLLLITTGVAFGDVVIDGLMVTEGQPRGLTGVLQSVQWTAAYAGLLLAGIAGGWLSQTGRADLAFALCALLWGVSLALAVLTVSEPRARVIGWRQLWPTIRAALATPGLLALSAFLFVWSFNLIWTSVLYLHLTVTLGMSEFAFGTSMSVYSFGAMCAAALYPLYCRRMAISSLTHLCIATGVVANVLYLTIVGQTSANAVLLLSGMIFMTGTMIQLDLVARHAPLVTAATVFALLMALSNLSTSMSEALGGQVYERVSALGGAHAAWYSVVLISALIPALCWLVTPWLRITWPDWSVRASEAVAPTDVAPQPAPMN